ncbi:MAG: hypothetical protein PF487_02255 [Bacteroidales bacterium]|jgi:hypothetical protein|nr:hypothetical protein [Bacteroidales bacterium]
MKKIRKGTKVKKIFDNKILKLKNYIMFEDRWISENDKILYNVNNEKFLVLEFQEVTENVLILDTMPYESEWREQKFSCVKLDKDVNVGDVFYTYI